MFYVVKLNNLLSCFVSNVSVKLSSDFWVNSLYSTYSPKCLGYVVFKHITMS